MDVKIYPSITTTNQDITKIQIKELQKKPIDELGLFITGLEYEQQRMDFLRDLKNPYHIQNFHLHM